MWARIASLGAIFFVWLGIRLATGRSVLHPWLLAVVLGALSATAGGLSESLTGRAAHVTYGVACFVGFGCLVAFAQGLRRESGAVPLSSRTLTVTLASAVAASVLCAALGTPRDRLVADTLGAAFLVVTTLSQLLHAMRRRLASRILATGVIVYALGRMLEVADHVAGRDVFATQHTADVAAILILGAGMTLHVLEGARAAVGQRRTVA